jgi:hypothetical protein
MVAEETRMNEPKIKRKFRSINVSLKTSESNSTVILFDDAAGGSIEIGTSVPQFTTLKFYASESQDLTFGSLRKSDGSEVTVTLSPSSAESRVYPIPDECYGVGAIKVLAGQPEGTAARCVVMLKG